MKILRTSSLDMISELPSCIIENILMLLPFKEAVRTSVLSKAWRHNWETLPHLVFDETFSPKAHKNRENLTVMIYFTLLIHSGPILKCTIQNCGLIHRVDIDAIVQILTSKGVQDLTLCMSDDDEPILLSPHVFSCSHLKHLSLHSFIFLPPPAFKGLKKLISLELVDVEFCMDDDEFYPDVSISGFPLLERLTLECPTNINCLSIDAPNLKFFYFKGVVRHISTFCTPLLTTLTLSQYDDIFETSSFDLFYVFGSVPLLENLQIYFNFLQILYDGEDEVPERLPNVLNNLKFLEITNICLMELDEIPYLFCLIRSFPDLEKLKLKVNPWPNIDEELVLEYLERQNYIDCSLDKLRELRIRDFSGARPELVVIKFLLAKSPELETLHISPCSNETDNICYSKLLEITHFHRASKKAGIIIIGLNDDQP